MRERDHRGQREQEDWGPVWVDGRIGYYDDDELEPCAACEKLDGGHERWSEEGACPDCGDFAIVYFEGLMPAPYELVPHADLLVASQHELQRAWGRHPNAWSLDGETLRTMGIPLLPPKRSPLAIDAPGPLVYFIRAGEHGPIKIGFTAKSLRSRLSALQTSTAEELRPLAYVRGDESLERELHARFCPLHIRGEWFRPEPELLEFIASCRGPG